MKRIGSLTGGLTKTFKTLLLAAALVAVTSAARAQVEFDHDVRFSMFGSRLSVYVEELSNYSDVATGRLRVRVFATEDYWDEGGRQHLLGSTTLPRVGANRHRHDVWRSMKLHRPDTDWYYVTIVLEERVFDEAGLPYWEVRDWRESDDRVFIRDTWFPLFPWD